MPAKDKKGKKVETGIWQNATGKGYIAEVSYRDPITRERVRKLKTISRIDLAREWRQAAKVDALRGELSKKTTRNVLFRDFAKEYLVSWGLNRKASTVRTETNRVNNILVPHFGAKPLQTVTQRDIERYLAKRRSKGINKEDGISQASANRELCRLKSMFKKALEWGYVDRNPAANIKQSKEKLSRKDFLMPEEVKALIETCEEHIRPIVTVAVHTGMRWGEVSRLTWERVDLENGTALLPETKNYEDREVPLNQSAREAIAGLAAGSKEGFVFINPKTAEPFDTIRSPFKRALKAAGITRSFSFHGLRHTAASLMVMAGVDLRTVGEILGHKSFAMTMRYAHLAPNHLKASVERLDGMVRGEGRV